MLVTEMAKTLTNILKLFPAHFVSNIVSNIVTNIDVTAKLSWKYDFPTSIWFSHYDITSHEYGQERFRSRRFEILIVHFSNDFLKICSQIKWFFSPGENDIFGIITKWFCLFWDFINLNSIYYKTVYCISLIQLRPGSFKLQTWTSIGKWFKYMRQAATTVNRIDVYICPSSRTLNAFKFAKGILVNEHLHGDVGDKVMFVSPTPVTKIVVTHLYLIRAFSVTILWVAASFSFEKNKSGFQICFRTSECTVSTSICVSLIVSFRPFWLFQKFFLSATLRFMWTIGMKCTVIKTRQVYCKKRYDFECGNIGRIIIQPRMVNQVY